MDLEIIYVPISEDSDYTPDLKKFRSAINKNTVMLIASAPQYPQGLMDPIEEIGKIGEAICFFIQKLSRPLEEFCCHLAIWVIFCQEPNVYYHISGIRRIFFVVFQANTGKKLR